MDNKVRSFVIINLEVISKLINLMLHKIAFWLLIIGGLNWGLEAFGYGIGNYVPAGLAMLIYVLVGISAIIEIVGHKKTCRNCNTSGGMQM